MRWQSAIKRLTETCNVKAYNMTRFSVGISGGSMADALGPPCVIPDCAFQINEKGMIKNPPPQQRLKRLNLSQ